MRNKTLDLIKLLSAYAVIFIHFRMPGIPGAFADALSRFAVPLFFVISGYYAFGNDNKKLKRKALNIGKLYLSATLSIRYSPLFLNLYKVELQMGFVSLLVYLMQEI